MPDITAAGTYTKDDAGLSALAANQRPREVRLSGNSFGDSCSFRFLDSNNVPRDLEGGTVTSLPYSRFFDTISELDVVFTGTPDCNLDIIYR